MTAIQRLMPGRVVATLTGEAVSAKTVSKLTRDLDQAVRQFHQMGIEGYWALSVPLHPSAKT